MGTYGPNGFGRNGLARRVRLVVAGMAAIGSAGLVMPLSVRAATDSPPAPPPPVATLGLGQAAFWNGTYVESGHVEDDGLCGTGAGPCFDYPLDLTRSGYRLRVAIDQPVRSNTWTIT